MGPRAERLSRRDVVVSLAAVSTIGIGAAIGPARAQSWPARAITAVVPFGPGTLMETAGRLVLEQVSKQLGQPVVVENRPGAGGTIAAASVARAQPDGYTLLLFSTSFSIAHSTYANRAYDTVRDFVPVTTYGMAPNVVVVSPERGWRTLDDLVAAARRRPGELNYASVGAGSAPHLAAERLAASAGFVAQNVAFRGPPEAMTETLTGRIDFYVAPLGTVLPVIRDSKLVPLAVSHHTRASALPQVPTTRELGLKEAELEVWFGIFAPAATSSGIVRRLYEETQVALDQPSIRERFATLGVEQLRLPPEEFAAYFRKDVEAMSELIRKVGLKGN